MAVLCGKILAPSSILAIETLRSSSVTLLVLGNHLFSLDKTGEAAEVSRGAEVQALHLHFSNHSRTLNLVTCWTTIKPNEGNFLPCWQPGTRTLPQSCLNDHHNPIYFGPKYLENKGQQMWLLQATVSLWVLEHSFPPQKWGLPGRDLPSRRKKVGWQHVWDAGNKVNDHQIYRLRWGTKQKFLFIVSSW